METSDLHFDADATKATSDMNLPTESKSVKRRSSERSLSHRAAHHRSSHRLRIHTSTAIPVSVLPDRWQEQENEQTNTFPLLHDFEAQRPDGIRTRQPCL